LARVKSRGNVLLARRRGWVVAIHLIDLEGLPRRGLTPEPRVGGPAAHPGLAWPNNDQTPTGFHTVAVTMPNCVEPRWGTNDNGYAVATHNHPVTQGAMRDPVLWNVTPSA
jgi:hypothetical protein